MNKKLRNSIMSLFLVAVILISGAFAYLTDTEEKTNTFTMGEVDITLTEPNWNPTKAEDLWAGKKLPKDPTVTNDGINDAYVYMMVEVPKASSLKIVGDDNASSLKENYPLFNFTANNGWTLIKSQVASDAEPYEDEAYDYYLYAYDTKLAKDESVTLFNEIEFANITEDFANALAAADNKSLEVKVTAYAIQSDLGANATDAATAWDLYANQNEWGWPERPYEGTLADLESKHEFEYYSKFSLAVNDVNNGEIGVNADVDRLDAVAGIYAEEGEAPTVVLFTDAEETEIVFLSTDMNINLAGNTLSFNNLIDGLKTSNNGSEIYIDGRIKGSTIEGVGTDAERTRCVSVFATDNVVIEGATITTTSTVNMSNPVVTSGTLNLNNCIIESKSSSGASVSVVSSSTTAYVEMNKCIVSTQSQAGQTAAASLQQGNASLTNCELTSTTDQGSVKGIQIGASSTSTTAIIKNCNIYACSNQEAEGIRVTGNSVANISNCSIYSDSPYKENHNSYGSQGLWINSAATAIVTNCNIKGVHSAIQNKGTLYVDGGTYQGWGHGGIYFAGSNNNAYIKNANLGQWDYDGKFDTAGMTAGNNGAAMYIGGSAGNDNINVYMDNCNLTALHQCIVLRGTDTEKNNTLHISNSTINTHDIRIDNTTHKLYIGKGCNFDVNSVASNQSVVTQTNEVYTFDMPN